jgi:hypothetical protein
MWKHCRQFCLCPAAFWVPGFWASWCVDPKDVHTEYALLDNKQLVEYIGLHHHVYTNKNLSILVFWDQLKNRFWNSAETIWRWFSRVSGKQNWSGYKKNSQQMGIKVTTLVGRKQLPTYTLASDRICTDTNIPQSFQIRECSKAKSFFLSTWKMSVAVSETII